MLARFPPCLLFVVVVVVVVGVDSSPLYIFYARRIFGPKHFRTKNQETRMPEGVEEKEENGRRSTFGQDKR